MKRSRKNPDQTTTIVLGILGVAAIGALVWYLTVKKVVETAEGVVEQAPAPLPPQGGGFMIPQGALATRTVAAKPRVSAPKPPTRLQLAAQKAARPKFQSHELAEQMRAQQHVKEMEATLARGDWDPGA